jgi:hypothetical protein
MKLRLHNRRPSSGHETVRSRPGRRYRLTQRLVAMLLASVALVDPLVEYAHEGWARHTICLEHGKTVDLSQGQGQRAAALSHELLSSPPTSDWLVQGQPGASHEGAHCSLCPYQREETSLPEGAGQATLRLAPEPPLTPTRITPWLPDAVPRLRIAPKNSPPV